MTENIGKELRKEFFEVDPEKTFTIPRFQRGYSWTTEHVTDFLNDLDNRLDDKLPHHFGTLFLRTDDNSDEREIIDGQQRITTVVLYLIACRDFLKKYDPKEAIKFLKDNSHVKFNETLDVAIKLSINASKTDQSIRGVIRIIVAKSIKG